MLLPNILDWTFVKSVVQPKDAHTHEKWWMPNQRKTNKKTNLPCCKSTKKQRTINLKTITCGGDLHHPRGCTAAHLGAEVGEMRVAGVMHITPATSPRKQLTLIDTTDNLNIPIIQNYFCTEHPSEPQQSPLPAHRTSIHLKNHLKS